MRQLNRILVIGLGILLVALLWPAAEAQASGGVGTTPCPGSLATRLEIGMEGQVAQRYSSLRNAPAGYVLRTMYHGARFTVIDGPACGGGLTHFKLDYGNGVVGWASESEIYSIYGNNQYWLEPVSEEPPPADGDCSGSLAPRLAVGDTGVVARSYSSLRTTPAGAVFAVHYHNESFTVLEGPVCAGYGDLAWYKIQYPNGEQGWASESQRYSEWGWNLYWLAPAG